MLEDEYLLCNQQNSKHLLRNNIILPDEVCPYAKIVPLKPPTEESTIGLATVLNTSKFLVPGPKT
jgi:hypothetical protein